MLTRRADPRDWARDVDRAVCDVGLRPHVRRAFDEEVARCVAYLDERGIERQVTFHVGRSEDVLPGLDPEPLDMVFIDGAHGFPQAIIDFFYTAGRLVEGGSLVLDDLHLPGVRLGLIDFLQRDPRWSLERRTPKWAAWRRLTAGTVSEHEDLQAFLGPPDRQERFRVKVVPRPLRPTARRVRDRLRAWTGRAGVDP